jgi:hypothetical protein
MQRPVVGTGNRIPIVRVPCSQYVVREPSRRSGIRQGSVGAASCATDNADRARAALVSLKRRAVGETMRRDAWWTHVVLVDEVNRAHTPRP